MMQIALLQLCCLFCLALPALSLAQVYPQRMDEAISLGDTALQRKILREWQFEWPNDPDRMLAQSAFSKRKHGLETDSLAKAAYLADAIAEIQAAVQGFPDRLDLRFAYISLLGDAGEYQEYTRQVLNVLDAHDRLGADWLWRNNSKLVGVDDFVRQYMDMYTLMLYNTKNDALHPLMDTISNRLLQSYPQHVPALFSISINALHRQDYPTAIAYLQKARTAEPQNTSVLDTLGLAYEKAGDTARAIECYEQIQEVGNDEEKAYATRKIQELGAP